MHSQALFYLKSWVLDVDNAYLLVTVLLFISPVHSAIAAAIYFEDTRALLLVRCGSSVAVAILVAAQMPCLKPRRLEFRPPQTFLA